ncbi:hypothetical protein Pmani_037631 [Petrolisthes manimaculis]|uniref:Uncharacterized protein n=1 Tax=Petrolisthes manimaculis TaxID=1843537 RepID=A0AAE1NFW7_9EUCA|nr:hypothetical protein Pmani_037631 [Petrolisthes manimaculis]
MRRKEGGRHSARQQRLTTHLMTRDREHGPRHLDPLISRAGPLGPATHLTERLPSYLPHLTPRLLLPPWVLGLGSS